VHAQSTGRSTTPGAPNGPPVLLPAHWQQQLHRAEVSHVINFIMLLLTCISFADKPPPPIIELAPQPWPPALRPSPPFLSLLLLT
jgi:hypothetical protein